MKLKFLDNKLEFTPKNWQHIGMDINLLQTHMTPAGFNQFYHDATSFNPLFSNVMHKPFPYQHNQRNSYINEGRLNDDQRYALALIYLRNAIVKMAFAATDFTSGKLIQAHNEIQLAKQQLASAKALLPINFDYKQSGFGREIVQLEKYIKHAEYQLNKKLASKDETANEEKNEKQTIELNEEKKSYQLTK